MFLRFFFFFVIFILPFSFALNPAQGIDLSLARVLIPLLFLAWFIDGLFKKRIILDTRLRFWFIFFLLFLAFFSFFWTLSPERWIRKILFLFSVILIYPVAFDILNRSQEHFFSTKQSAHLSPDFVTSTLFKKISKCNVNLILFLKTIFWSNLILALIGLILFFSQFIFGLDETLIFIRKFIAPFFLGENFSGVVLAFPSWLVNISGKTVMRTFGVFPDPHIFSLYLNFSLPLIFYLWKKNGKPHYLIGFILIFLASLFSFSRAAYFSLFSAVLFILFFYPFKNIKKLRAFILALFFTFLIILPTSPGKRFISSFDLKEGSNAGRIVMLRAGFNATVENPFLGFGIGGFSKFVEPYSELRSPIYTHNLILDFSSELGIFGGVLVLFLILSPIIIFFLRPKKLIFFIALSFVILFSHSLFETPFYSVNFFPLLLTVLSIKES